MRGLSLPCSGRDGRVGLPVVLIVVGAGLTVVGAVLAVAWHGYEIFSMPIMSWRDVAAAAAVSVVGLALVVVGVALLFRARRNSAA
jgi:uncharacterized membrane protein